MSVFRFTRNVRSLNRLRHIAQVLTQHGFGHIVAQVNLARFVPVWMMRRKRAGDMRQEGPKTVGRRLAAVFTELGPTAIKLGQMLSTRPDVIPAELAQELRGLQDKVAPFESGRAKAIIEEELGGQIESMFASFDETPVASGSIGQVHRATALDGAPLMIKVQRPEIEQIIRLDMELLHWLAESLESLIPDLRHYRPTMLVDELEETLIRELDYINEASVTSRFADAFRDVDGIRIPKVYWDLTATKVITLQELSGTSVGEVISDSGGGGEDGGTPFDRPLAARRLAECYFTQIFELGTFHADPHPGNILIQQPAEVALLDFGQVGVITEETMGHLVVLLFASVNREVGVIVETLADMGAVISPTDQRGLHRAVQGLLDKYHGLPLKHLDFRTLLNEFSDAVRRYGVVMPRDVALMIKAFGTVAAVCGELDENLNPLELLQPKLKKVLGDRVSASRIARGLAISGWHLLSVLRQGPGQLRQALRRLSSGNWQLRIRHENLERLTDELDRSSNRLAFSVVIAAIIVGSSVVVSADSTLTLLGIRVQYLGIAGYLVAGVLGLGLSWAIYRSGRLH